MDFTPSCDLLVQPKTSLKDFLEITFQTTGVLPKEWLSLELLEGLTTVENIPDTMVAPWFGMTSNEVSHMRNRERDQHELIHLYLISHKKKMVNVLGELAEKWLAREIAI